LIRVNLVSKLRLVKRERGTVLWQAYRRQHR